MPFNRKPISTLYEDMVHAMLTKQKMERKLQLYLLNVCLAAATARENDLREAKNALMDAIYDMLVTASRGGQ